MVGYSRVVLPEAGKGYTSFRRKNTVVLAFRTISSLSSPLSRSSFIRSKLLLSNKITL